MSPKRLRHGWIRGVPKRMAAPSRLRAASDLACDLPLPQNGGTPAPSALDTTRRAVVVAVASPIEESSP